MSNDHQYYENPELWRSEIYASAFEVARLDAGVAFVPEGVRNLLDVGCGNGSFLQKLESGRPEIMLSGTDRSRAAISAKLCRANVEVADISGLPFSDRSFEFVSCLAVIEHLPLAAYEAALRELQRVAAKHILINVPFNEKRVRAHCPSCGCAFDPHYHMRRYTEKDIHTLFEKFAVEKIQILSGPEPFVSWAIRRTRLDLSARRFPNSICPQCGFSAVGTRQSSQAKKKADVKSILRRALKAIPDITEQREIFVLYKRL